MTITDGIDRPQCITWDDIALYTQGECWYLASILRTLTGWPVVFFIPAGRESQEDFDHVLVRTPDGQLLDVYGAQSEAEVRARWGKDGVLVDAASERALRILAWTPRTESDHLHAVETEVVARLLLAEMEGNFVGRP